MLSTTSLCSTPFLPKLDAMPDTYGAKIIAQSLHDLGVKVIFGTPGLPVTDIAQEGLYLGIRFISFRNEQAAVYAATAYGYLTGKPGVCISVGGPGMLHVFAGVCNAFNDEEAVSADAQ